jgi:GH15 family glucan-1,4-alpha-glucosidase
MSGINPGPDPAPAAPTTQFRPIAEYGMLADCNAAALADRDGSISWLCLPRYDSPAVFARILDPAGGHWSIAPTQPYRTERRYVPGTLVIETTFATQTGSVKLIDAMAFAEGQRSHELGFVAPHLVLRSVEGLVGEVELRLELAPRSEYGLVKPLFRQTESGGRTFGGPNQIVVCSGVPSTIEDATMMASFTVAAGEEVGFALQLSPPEGPAPEPIPREKVARAGSRTRSRHGARGRASTTSTRVRTASSCASAPACSRA